MSISIDNYNKLMDKSKSKKDGVYSMKPYMYVVRDKTFVAYSDIYGDCFAVYHGFTTRIGTVEKYDIRKKLTEWLKQQ